MSDEILINVSPSETRVALIEGGLLQELYLERTSAHSHVGKIFQGQVKRVLPGMQAAFVDIGLDRTAFLHVAELAPPRSGLDDEEAQAVPLPNITELVREGQEVLVQVIKDPIGSKGARLTTHLSIPSRYLVLLPQADSIGISVRIESEEERQRLKGLLESELPEGGDGFGYILRTNAEGVSADAIAQDLEFLHRLWGRIRAQMSEAKPGDLLFSDLSLPLRSLRDVMGDSVERVRIDHEATCRQTQKFLSEFMPEWLDRVEYYAGPGPLFDLFGVEDEIQRALSRTTTLKSGGHIVIDQTEAMTTVDVNTGGYVGHRTLEETIFKTNLEAAQAIARQLRLRSLGGIIIIDFIDMYDEEHKRQVLRTLERALERDHARTMVNPISSLGLVEMTRKRTTESLEQRLCEICPTCSGRGTIKSAETVSFEIYREILRAVRQFETGQLLVLASARVVECILDEQNQTVADLEELVGKSIRFQGDEQYSQEQFDVVLL